MLTHEVFARRDLFFVLLLVVGEEDGDTWCETGQTQRRGRLQEQPSIVHDASPCWDGGPAPWGYFTETNQRCARRANSTVQAKMKHENTKERKHEKATIQICF